MRMCLEEQSHKTVNNMRFHRKCMITRSDYYSFLQSLSVIHAGIKEKVPVGTTQTTCSCDLEDV